MSTMDELIEKLEKAEAGGRELDDDIWGWLSLTAGSRSIVQQFNSPARFTTSLDAALTLVPEGWTAWDVGSRQGRTRYRATVSRLAMEVDGVEVEDEMIGHSRTPALALCIAAIKARKIIQGSDTA